MNKIKKIIIKGVNHDDFLKNFCKIFNLPLASSFTELVKILESRGENFRILWGSLYYKNSDIVIKYWGDIVEFKFRKNLPAFAGGILINFNNFKIKIK